MIDHERVPKSSENSEWDDLSEVEPRFELQNRVATKFNNPKNKDTLMRALKTTLLAAGLATTIFMGKGEAPADTSTAIQDERLRITSFANEGGEDIYRDRLISTVAEIGAVPEGKEIDQIGYGDNGQITFTLKDKE